MTASRVATEYGTPVGYLLVCKDVTERERRDRRLRVLTQFLAGTIGKRARALADRGRQISTDADTPSDGQKAANVPIIARDIHETTGSLKRLVSTTREVERTLSKHGDERAPVVATVRELVKNRQDVTVVDADADPDSMTTAVNSAVLRAILTLLIKDLHCLP